MFWLPAKSSAIAQSLMIGCGWLGTGYVVVNVWVQDYVHAGHLDVISQHDRCLPG